MSANRLSHTIFFATLCFSLTQDPFNHPPIKCKLPESITEGQFLKYVS